MVEGDQDLEDATQNGTKASEIAEHAAPLSGASSANIEQLQNAPQAPTPLPLPNGASHVPESAPRGKKRKLAEVSQLQRSRALSPPWKKIEAEGPTSFMEDGRRKSGRVNNLPQELPPTKAKRQSRTALQKISPDKVKRASERTAASTNRNSKLPKEPSVKPDPRPRNAPRSAKEPQAAQSKQKGSQIAMIAEDDILGKTGRQVRGYGRRNKQVDLPQPAEDKRRRMGGKTNGTTNHLEDKVKLETLPVTLKPIKSLKINFRPPPLPILNPSNIPAPCKFASVRNLLAQDDPLEDEEEEVAYTEAVAKQEAKVIEELESAARPGGYLHGEAWLDATMEVQDEPETHYTHPDYLLKHIIDFQPRLERERALHLATAKRLAHLALAEWRRRQPKSDEELSEEQMRLFVALYKKALKEMDNKWTEVIIHVKQRKLLQYEEEQQKLGKKALNAMLDQSDQMLVGRRQSRMQADDVEDEEQGSDDNNTEDQSDSNDDDDESVNSSASDAESSREESIGSDDELTAEELRRKYSSVAAQIAPVPVLDNDISDLEGDNDAADAPDQGQADLRALLQDEAPSGLKVQSAAKVSHIPDNGRNDGVNSPEHVDDTAGEEKLGIDPSKVVMDEVDDILLDDDDEESDSDDDGDSEDEDDNSAEDEDEDDDGEDEEDNGLLGFLTKKQVKAMTNGDDTSANHIGTKAVGDEDSPANADSDVVTLDAGAAVGTTTTPHETESDQASSAVDTPVGDYSSETSPANISTTKHSEADPISSIEPDQQVLVQSSSAIVNPDANRIEVPFLLRGTLREYQHNGLDWLAGMHRSQTNGILADEMGLGKTIQTISLLAHLATKEHIWGPHLVVVPTSVMLNWEVEFKKFLPAFKILTYYGTQEERKRKRLGWTNNDMWNVVITSYQLALQDAAILKRKAWHYLVLDEAHNIKNFQSKRWQTLLTFNSQARLLLTGTPLQNNLTELWSLLFFLRPGESETGGVKFADLATFNKVFHRPVDQIMESGREALDDEAKESVTKLHRVLRPHLLRRLKADVEKQMPKKYEHIVKCRLSKRQRQLYDGYMGLTGTRESFQSGNYMSIINCLMQLRKVCNHPDLFETRQIVTSYAMPKSAVAEFEIKELLVRRRITQDEDYARAGPGLLNLWRENMPFTVARRSNTLASNDPLDLLAQGQDKRLDSMLQAGSDTIASAYSGLKLTKGRDRLSQIHEQRRRSDPRTRKVSAYPASLLRRLHVDLKPTRPSRAFIVDVSSGLQAGSSMLTSDTLAEMVTTLPARSEAMDVAVQKFGCVTPAVVAPKMAQLALTERGVKTVLDAQTSLPGDAFHEARTRLSIAFPDKSLIQYDCGKLQALARLLRDLQAKGSRALIFTQMTKVLDILEQFLNLHGHRYLRLDGSTRIEARQHLTERFNSDPRILAFILSSRSGGLGINLTGADTVIFYDLDWNPAMDKQCQDRAHRIGQTRDVHIYRFISEGTIEANILRKSNQKRMLDDVVIQEGDFTTEYFNRIDPRELLENDNEVDAAVDKIFGGREMQADQVLEQVEDTEDRAAAEIAQKEHVHVDAEDAEDFQDIGDASEQPAADTPKSDAPPTPAALTVSNTRTTSDSPAAQDVDMQDVSQVGNDEAGDEEEEPGSYEEYMLRFVEWDLKDVVIKPPSERSRKRAKKGKDYAMSRIRR